MRTPVILKFMYIFIKICLRLSKHNIYNVYSQTHNVFKTSDFYQLKYGMKKRVTFFLHKGKNTNLLSLYHHPSRVQPNKKYETRML